MVETSKAEFRSGEGCGGKGMGSITDRNWAIGLFRVQNYPWFTQNIKIRLELMTIEYNLLIILSKKWKVIL